MPELSASYGAVDRRMAARLAESVLARDSTLTPLATFHDWFAGVAERVYTEATRIPLDDIEGWHTDPVTGNIGHRSGKFFTVEGLEVRAPGEALPRWSQPIIHQPEVGILGILLKEFDGVLHCLMQAKGEPGNCNGLQLSPTVQATRSNYARVHQGRSVPYIEYFREAARHRPVTDVRQSEQGSWFYRKRNRNMVVEVTDEVELLDGFCWLTLGQLHQLLATDNLVNMDARTVLACLPFTGEDVPAVLGTGAGGFAASLARSCGARSGAVHPPDDILRWITEVRSASEVTVHRTPLHDVERWKRGEDSLSHESGRFFSVIGVHVQAGGREVKSWAQPMIEPHGTGIAALLVKQVDGVLHALMHSLSEPGFVDATELAPTVQCTPDDFPALPSEARPLFLDQVLGAPPARVRFDTTLSEEGGRFYHAQNRYLIVEAEDGETFDHPDYRWTAVHQLTGLLRHSHYLNIQARSLLACLHSLSGQPATP